MDVRTAFLHGEVDENVYTCSPPGLELCKSSQVLKLWRGLYGLKQSPKLWHKSLLAIMNSMRFSRIVSDICAFGRGRAWLLLYVDDIIGTEGRDSDIQTVKEKLNRQLDAQDMGHLRTF